jgi:hypothetical protein
MNVRADSWLHNQQEELHDTVEQNLICPTTKHNLLADRAVYPNNPS